METAHKNGYTAHKLALEEGVQAEMLCTDGEKLYVIGKLGMQWVIFSFAQDGTDLEKTELDGLENGSIQCFRKVEHGWLLLLEREESYEIVTLDEDGSEKNVKNLIQKEQCFFIHWSLWKKGKCMQMDLTDFLKEDTEISQEDFLPNIIEACKIDGKIYFILDSFYIRMLAGEHSVIQGREKWNMKEFSELYQTLKKGEEVMAYYVDQEDMMEILCDSMLPSYLDMDTGMADFRQDSFRRILECAKSTEWNGNDDAFKIMEKIQNGTIQLIRFDMGGYRDYAFYKGILKNGGFIGFPTEKGSGFCAAVYGKPILSVTEKSSLSIFKIFLDI